METAAHVTPQARPARERRQAGRIEIPAFAATVDIAGSEDAREPLAA